MKERIANRLFLVNVICWIVIILLFPINLFAAPSITSAPGVLNHGEMVAISGANFGIKSPARPHLWAPFEGSSAPSELGLVTSWSGLGNMEYTPDEGVGGTGGLKAANSGGAWTARVDANGFAWNDYNQQMYLFRKTNRNFDVTDDLNWKIWRTWGTGYIYPSMYTSSANGIIAVEGVSQLNAASWMSDKISARGITGEYKTEEIILQANSGPDEHDGLYWMYVNGIEVAKIPYQTYNYRTLRMNDGSGPMIYNFVVHGVKANTTFPEHYRYWADDVYLDTTWARVMLGSASTLEQSTHREPLIPSAWSSTSITVTVNAGTFATGQIAYIYVVDAEGNVNSDGYPVVIGETQTGSPPTISPPPSLRIH